jgi:hypothetical protein
MHPMAVIGFALGIGAIVFAISFWGEEDAFGLRLNHRNARGAETSAETPSLGFGQPGGPLPSPAGEGTDGGDAFTYVPVIQDAPTWRTRLSGVLGLVLFVVLGGTLLALSAYQVGHLINETIAKYLQK